MFCHRTAIDPLPGVYLTVDLTNHNAESAILPNQQTRQESCLRSAYVVVFSKIAEDGNSGRRIVE